MKQLHNIDKIVENSFGLWISSLFSAIGSYNPSLSFDDRKEAFFSLLEQLLRAGRIKFIAPGADCYTSRDNPHPKLKIQDDEAHWHEPPEDIIFQLRQLWPVGASHDDDLDLATYFYSIPGVIWIADDGTMLAS